MDYNDNSSNLFDEQIGGQHQNRFIFSNDYYDDMPLDADNRMDVAKKVEPYINSTTTSNSNLSNNSNSSLESSQIVHQTNDFDKLVQNEYMDSNTNTFDFFSHNANTGLDYDTNTDSIVDSSPIEETVDVENDKDKDIDTPILNDVKSGIFQSLENNIFNRKKEDENIVHLDKPIVEEDSLNIGRAIEIPKYEEVVEPVQEDVPGPLEPIETVDPTGVSDKIIDNIVDYQANIPEDISTELPETNKFIVNNDDSVLVDDKPKEMVAPNLMDGSQKVSNFEIDTGINQELEQELIKQKELEEQERLKNNPELNDYLRYTPEEATTEVLYKAGGKSIVREKQPQPVINPVSVRTPVVASSEEIPDLEPQVVNIDEEIQKKPQNIQEMIEDILDIPNLDEMVVPINPSENPGVKFGSKEIEEEPFKEGDSTTVYDEKKDNFNYDQNFDNVEVIKSDLLDQLKEKADQEGKISILARYGEDFCSKDYITNPAIGRAEEIKQLILILLTPEKSGILIGKPGIGKTSIVEGLAYQLQRNNVPDALKGYVIVSVKTASLLGNLPTGETRLQTLVDELKTLDKIILFIDEIHMLIGATNESSLDFANMFKESLGRGSIKVIGATTTEEYERYILRDKAFVRRFQKVEVEEPDREHTIKILIGTLPKIEKTTGAKLKYTDYIQSEIMAFIVDITTEYKRIYGIGSRYPDICLTLLAQAFSQAVFANRKEVTIMDIRKAIENSKNIYPDVIRKELVNFDKKFKDIIREEELNN